ncbi:MAG: hypothetical protein FD155_2723 [Bacteroidetes bacterium]|nr:MAG: hypothetical protein FD155_2723 [Bacteroidota bacterium]
MIDFTSKDTDQINQKGIDFEIISKQIDAFKKGYPFINLVAPATIGHGIMKYHEEEINELIEYFDEGKDNYDLLKFVPASGAASRMFKHLYDFVQAFKGTQEEINALENDSDPNSVGYLIQHIDKMAFYKDLKDIAIDNGLVLEELLDSKRYDKVIQLILQENGLNYGNLPKALLRFHRYESENRFAIEEHLVEAAIYCTNEFHVAKIHFTISAGHRNNFISILDDIVPAYEKKYGVKYELTFSEQKPSTDTIAVDMENKPFRNDDGSLLFRPGGHGALIENLNDLKEEIIFVKNIDNIVPDSLREETYRYKKAIGGLLLQLLEKTYDYLDILDGGFLEEHELEEIRKFAEQNLLINIPSSYDGLGEMEKIDYLYSQLNRPMRICGMVKNEGEPGGGPYWVKNSEGVVSLQIVESSQMDLKNKAQLELVKSASHFNPVDLVCGIYDFKGQKFNLPDFIDNETGFISTKSKDGRELKALELPGLWNGAMADWITVFVETPLITFNPVKTVNDLLRPQHQA